MEENIQCRRFVSGRIRGLCKDIRHRRCVPGCTGKLRRMSINRRLFVEQTVKCCGQRASEPVFLSDLHGRMPNQCTGSMQANAKRSLRSPKSLRGFTNRACISQTRCLLETVLNPHPCHTQQERGFRTGLAAHRLSHPKRVVVFPGYCSERELPLFYRIFLPSLNAEEQTHGKMERL